MNKLAFAIFCLIALIFLLRSCMGEEQHKTCSQNQINVEARIKKPEVSYNDTPRGISIQVIDGCQYVYAETNNGVAIVHKANCNNPIH